MIFIFGYGYTANFFCENDIIRITGDSPLVDIKILKKMIDIYNSKKYDLVTNVFPRTFAALLL